MININNLIDKLNKLPNRKELGEQYFNMLDDLIKHDSESAMNLLKTTHYPIIASGGYKDFLESLGIKVTIPVIGHIRQSRQIDLTEYEPIIKNHDFTFLDDSYYKGRTLRKIFKEIIRLGGRIKEVNVVYNDSNDPFVFGLINKTDLSN